MFSSRKKDRDKDSVDSASIHSNDGAVTNPTERFEFNALTDRELDAMFSKSMADINIKKDKVNEMLKQFDRDKKIQLCQQGQRVKLDNPNKDTPLYYCTQMKEALNTKEDEQMHTLLQSLCISLRAMSINWVQEFQREGGLQLLVTILDRLIQQTEKSHQTEDAQEQEDDGLVGCLLEMVKCIRSVINIRTGAEYFLQPDSLMCYKLIEALYVLNSMRSSKVYEQPISAIITLLIPALFLNKEQPDPNEMTGYALVMRTLSEVGEQRGKGRFACIVGCFRHKNAEITLRALTFINILLSNTDDSEWQVRMLWRSELMSAGLKNVIPSIEEEAVRDEKLQQAYTTFDNEKKADFEDLLKNHSNLKGDIDHPKDCFNMLIAASKNTECEDHLLDIGLKLLLVNDRKYRRATYLKMINKFLTGVICEDVGCGPDIIDKQIVFTTPLDEMLQQIENDPESSRMSKRLETAIGAKQEAMVMQNKYYHKMVEFREESAKLRKHITNKSDPIPPATQCDLLPPEEAHLLNVAIGPKAPSGSGSAPPPLHLPRHLC
uniref:GBD/FH3 domain-containing protein n=1 Tax=Ditylenchus dipsaci TaxID=166011 RepID=A0A915EAR0_9BILA